MRDGVGVPSLREHGDGYDAAYGFAERAGLADGVHRLAEQVLVGHGVGLGAVAGSAQALAAEAVYLLGGGAPEVGGERVPAFELLAVDEQRSRRRAARAVFPKVVEQAQPPVARDALAVFGFALEARYVVVHHLGCGGVAAYDDEARRRGHAGFLPALECLFVVSIKRVERGLEQRGQCVRVGGGRGFGDSPPGARHVVSDMLPEIAVARRVLAGDVVVHRHARELDDAAFDGVHQREVAHRPREQRPLGVAGAAQEEGRGGQVDHLRQADFAPDGFESAYPDAGGVLVLLRLLAVFGGQLALVVAVALEAVAVMPFVVERHDILHAHQLRHDAAERLPFGLGRPHRLAGSPADEAARPGGYGLALARREGVVVGYDDFRHVEGGQHVGRDELAGFVVGVRVVGLENAQPVPDGDSGRDHEKAAREAGAGGTADGVDGLPRDEHRHDCGFARAGGEFERDSRKLRVRFGVDAAEALAYGAPVAQAVGDFGEPDGGLRRFDLAEEGAVGCEPMLAPVSQKAGGLRRHAPVAGVGDDAPSVHAPPNGVHVGVAVVALDAAVGRAVDVERHLRRPAARRRDGRDERRRPPALDHARHRLPGGVQLPVARRALVWRVEYRVFVEVVFHAGASPWR